MNVGLIRLVMHGISLMLDFTWLLILFIIFDLEITFLFPMVTVLVRFRFRGLFKYATFFIYIDDWFCVWMEKRGFRLGIIQFMNIFFLTKNIHKYILNITLKQRLYLHNCKKSSLVATSYFIFKTKYFFSNESITGLMGSWFKKVRFTISIKFIIKQYVF